MISLGVGPLIGAAAIFTLAVFLKYPAPKFSSRLQAWKKKGFFLTVRRRQIFYIDESGTGPSRSLLCLHGFPTSSYDWIKVLPQLKEHFSRVIMLDFLGFGFSDKPRNIIYTIGDQADFVQDLLESLNVSRVHILSHDYGDTVALELLARFNASESSFTIESLTLLNGGIFPQTHHPRRIQKLLLTPVLGYIGSHLFSYIMFSKAFGEVFGERKPSKEDLLDFWAALRHKDGDRATLRVINFLRERKAFEEKWVGALKSSSVKVLMIYGPADPVNPPVFAQHFKSTVPQHSLVTLAPEIGHYPQWEDPDTVGRHFCDFISDLGK